MSVLAEAFSVVVRRSTIADKYPGGLVAYRRDCPNQTFCADEHLTRVGFMTPTDVQSFVGLLQFQGIRFLLNGVSDEIVVVDQNDGPTVPCAWIEFEKTGTGESHCWLKGTDRGSTATPIGWSPRQVHKAAEGAGELGALGHADGLDVFEDKTGRRGFIGRSFGRTQEQDIAELRDRASGRGEGHEVVEGELLGGRWPIYKVMAGGMGQVYVIFDSELAQLVAAKTFRDEAFSSGPGSTVAERFRQEANAWIRIGLHPNVVKAHRIVSVKDKPYILLDYVSGGSLTRWIGTPRLTEDLAQILRFGIDFCRGMEFALSQGVEAHRDVKPDNCLITEDNVLKITDFGLAKVLGNEEARQLSPLSSSNLPKVGLGSLIGKWFGWLAERTQPQDHRQEMDSDGLTQTGSGAGTPPYMAPEQFDDLKRVDHRADIYSFGVMLFQMVTGALPYVGRTFEEFRQCHTLAPLPRIPFVDDALERGIHKCMAKNPSHRFVDFGEIESRLSDIYERVAGQAPPKIPQATAWTQMHTLSRAYSLANLEMYPDALRLCDDILNIDPLRFEAWALKGRLLNILDQNSEAIRCHDKAIELSPDHPDVWHSKGITLNSISRLPEALRCYDRALAINERHSKAWYDKGVTLQRMGRIMEAGDCWSRSLALDPDNPMAWCNRGSALFEIGDAEAAVSSYKRALGLDPRDAKAWYGLGLTLAETGTDIPEAMRCLHTANRLGMIEAKDALECFRHRPK